MSSLLFTKVSQPNELVHDLDIKYYYLDIKQFFCFRFALLCSFAESVFVPKLSDQVRNCLLPKLKDPEVFPFKDLLQCLKNTEYTSSAYLLYSVLELAQSNAGRYAMVETWNILHIACKNIWFSKTTSNSKLVSSSKSNYLFERFHLQFKLNMCSCCRNSEIVRHATLSGNYFTYTEEASS